MKKVTINNVTTMFGAAVWVDFTTQNGEGRHIDIDIPALTHWLSCNGFLMGRYVRPCGKPGNFTMSFDQFWNSTDTADQARMAELYIVDNNLHTAPAHLLAA